MDQQTAFRIEILRDAIAANEADPGADQALLARQRQMLAETEERAAKGITTPSLEAPNDPGFVNRPQAGTKAANQFGTFQVKAATPAQVRFLERLLAERDLSSLTRGPAALDQHGMTVLREEVQSGRINKRKASDLIERLLACPQRGDVAARPDLATEKQVAFLRSLAQQRGVALEQREWSKAEASAEIERLKTLPRDEVLKPELEAGMYRHPGSGEILKVYRAVHGSNRMCAKRLVVVTEATMNLQSGRIETPGDVKFEYLGLATKYVNGHVRMTLAEAKEFGTIYGVCCSCGATLTDEGSIEAGIGPVCARKFA